jgi:hypothetical protein
MTQEQEFLNLLSQLESCSNREQRESLLAEIAPLTEQVHFSRKMWSSLTARISRVRIIGETLGRQN